MIDLEKKEKKYDKTSHFDRFEIIRKNWDEIVNIIKEELPSVEKMQQILKAINIPEDFLHIGADNNLVCQAFDFTKDIIPNHMISTDVKDMPEFFQNEKFDGNSMMCKKLNMLPIECIVRGYITGSGWESYKKDGTVCGIKLPEGLQESDKLPEPIYTPTTKAEIGDHDEHISFEESVEILEKLYPGKGRDYATQIKLELV